MATELAKAYVQIIPSMEGIKGELGKALDGEADSAGKNAGGIFGKAFEEGSEGEGEKAGGKFAKALQIGMGAAKIGAAAVAAVGTATIAAGAALVKGAGDVAAYGDNIDKMSQKLGMSATAYQEWDAVMRHSGTSIESMQSSMKTLANAVEKNNGAFERLGMSQEAIAGMSNEELFSATITALQGVENETERTYLAGQLLGRGATELGALLNTSAEDTQAMKDRVHELGGVMSDEAVKAAAAYQDSLQDMQTAFGGLKNNLLSEFLPGITTVMEGLTAIFAGDSETGLSQISAGIEGVISTISGKVPEFLQLGSTIIISLTTAISDNLPMLLSSGAEVILTIVNEGILPNLSTIVAAGLDIIISITNGIAENLPELIPTVIDVVLQIVDTLTNPDTLVSLVGASIAIIIALAEGLIEALPQLDEKVKEGFWQKVEDAKQWGKDLIQNFIDGITHKWRDLKESVTNLAGTVKSILGFSEPEEGPLADFHTYAPDMVKLFAKGVTDNIGIARKAVGKLSDAVADAWQADSLSTAVTAAGAHQFGGAGAAGYGSRSNAVTVNVYGAEGQSAEDIARRVVRIITQQIETKEAAWA